MAEAGTSSSLNPFPPLPGHRAGRHLPASLARGPSPLWVGVFHASLQCDLALAPLLRGGLYSPQIRVGLSTL